MATPDDKPSTGGDPFNQGRIKRLRDRARARARARAQINPTLHENKSQEPVQDWAAGLNQLAQNAYLHRGGKHVKLGSNGLPLDAGKPTGLDWLTANGPQRPEVAQRTAALNRETGIESSPDNPGAFAKLLAASRPSLVQDNQNGTRLALDRSGRPVGFATYANPVPTVNDPNPSAPRHLPKGPQDWPNPISDVQQSIERAVNPFAQQRISPIPPAPQVEALQQLPQPSLDFEPSNIFNPPPGLKSQTSERPADPVYRYADPENNTFTQEPAKTFLDVLDKPIEAIPNGLLPRLSTGVDQISGLLQDAWNRVMRGENTHQLQDAVDRTVNVAKTQNTYKPRQPTTQPSTSKAAQPITALGMDLAEQLVRSLGTPEQIAALDAPKTHPFLPGQFSASGEREKPLSNPHPWLKGPPPNLRDLPGQSKKAPAPTFPRFDFFAP